MARASIGLRRTGWLALGLGLLASVGCVSIQIGGNATDPPPSASRPYPAELAGVQQANYSTGTTAAAPPAVTHLPGAAVPGPMVGDPIAPGAPPVLAAPATPHDHLPPTELRMKSLPPYRVEPPDILILDTIRMVPHGPYTVAALDQLLIRVAEPLPNQPIDGIYTVSPEGVINLGYSYGAVRVGGMTLEGVEKTIRLQLSKVLDKPQVAVGLAQYRGVQQVRGTHLVRPDGTLNLGSYGCVYVAGLCLNEVKVAVERHLARFAVDPEISVDVLGYNSKVIYVISDGAGYGQTVVRLPVTGKETVLDAIASLQVQGLSQVSSKKHIWVARPGPPDNPCLQILPVDWRAISEGGATTTNYQLFPGDRVYIGPNPLIKTDNILAQILAPMERLLGFTLLGTSVFNNLRSNGGNGNTGVGFIAPIP